MRRPILPGLLTALLLSASLHVPPALGQPPASAPGAAPAVAVDSPDWDAAMPTLARQALAQYQDENDERRLGTRFRLQLLAGDEAAALDSIGQLRRIHAAQRLADAELSFVQYELYARARLRSRAQAQPFEAAFREVFTETFRAFSDRQAYRAGLAFGFDLARGEQAWRRHVAGISGTADLTPAQVLDLLRDYQPHAAYRAMLPLAGALLEADARARYITEQVAIRTPEGATLSAFVVRPRGAQAPLPTALQFTIYAEPERPWSPAQMAAARGYAGVIAFSRGKLASPDAIAPYEHEVHDVNAVIDWIARQPWSNGAVGMYGGSYNGFAQWAALKHPHPALKTIVPYVAAIPGLGLPMENNVGLTANYGWAFFVGNNSTLDHATYDDRPRWNSLSQRWFESGRPYREIDQVDGTPNPWLQRWLQHAAYDAYWQAMGPHGREFAKIDLPVLSISGYYDDGQISAIEYLKQHEAWHRNADHVLLIGPYDHVGAQSWRKPTQLRGLGIDATAQFDTPDITFQWLDHILRGAARPALLQARINAQLMGTDRWLQAPSLRALNARRQTFWLSDAAADVDSGRHRLAAHKPARRAALEQTVDFRDRHSESNDYYPSPIVRRELDTSSGFTFVSEPLPAARTLAGTFSGLLRLSLNKRDVDVGVVLYELTPEGEYLHLSYFLGRASHAGDMGRRRLLTPGRITSVPFERTRMVVRQLRAGSRLVVQVNVNKNSGAQVNHGSGKDVSDESIADAGVPLKIRWHNDSWISLPLQ